MVEIANIREQCSWIHKDKAEGTEKAISPGRGCDCQAVQLNAPADRGRPAMLPSARLVIGGGIAGIQTALDVADAGYEVDIVEKRPTIGGRMAQLDKTFPTLDCAACILTPKMVEAAQNEKINIISYAKLKRSSGFVGNFTATIRKKARFVDETKCTGCAACTTEKCPSRKGKNEFNMGLDNRGAIYIPFAQAIPNVAVDRPGALHQAQDRQVRSVREGMLRGRDQLQAAGRDDRAASTARSSSRPASSRSISQRVRRVADTPVQADVVTSLEFERLMNAAGPTKGTLLRPSDGNHPHDDRVHTVRRQPLRRKREAAASLTARRSAACTPPSTRCLCAKSTRTPTCTYSTSTCVPPARTSTSSIAARSSSTAWTTSRAWSARSRGEGEQAQRSGQRPAIERAGAYRGRHGRSRHGDRAGSHGARASARC